MSVIQSHQMSGGRGDNVSPQTNDSADFAFMRPSMMHVGLIIFCLAQCTFVLDRAALITGSFTQLRLSHLARL